MARVFVTSDDESVRVEIDTNPLEETYSAVCAAHGTPVDYVAETRERFNFEDTVEVAKIHVDSHGRAS